MALENFSPYCIRSSLDFVDTQLVEIECDYDSKKHYSFIYGCFCSTNNIITLCVDMHVCHHP